MVPGGSRPGNRRARRCADDRLGIPPFGAVGGTPRALAGGARGRRGIGIRRRRVGAPGTKRRPVCRAGAGIHVARGPRLVREPRRLTRQPRISRTHVGALCDVDLARGVRRGERGRAHG
jgi:hypothetical protein